MITTAKVLLFPELRKCFMLFAQFFDAKNTKAAPESLQLKYGFFYFFQKIFGTREAHMERPRDSGTIRNRPSGSPARPLGLKNNFVNPSKVPHAPNLWESPSHALPP